DQPIAALLRDLKQRGLLDETLVIWSGEFGRTPMRENRGGRDERPREDRLREERPREDRRDPRREDRRERAPREDHNRVIGMGDHVPDFILRSFALKPQSAEDMAAEALAEDVRETAADA
ncbi:MAG: hypothetical protein RI979_2169, partial [Pseudomonadota bacterium]